MPNPKTWPLILTLALIPVAADAGGLLEEVGAVNRDQQCAAQVAQALTQFNIDPQDVIDYSVLPVEQFREGGKKLIGWEAFVNRKSCPGTTVIQMKRDCQIKGRYGQGGC